MKLAVVSMAGQLAPRAIWSAAWSSADDPELPTTRADWTCPLRPIVRAEERRTVPCSPALVPLPGNVWPAPKPGRAGAPRGGRRRRFAACDEAARAADCAARAGALVRGAGGSRFGFTTGFGIGFTIFFGCGLGFGASSEPRRALARAELRHRNRLLRFDLFGLGLRHLRSRRDLGGVSAAGETARGASSIIIAAGGSPPAASRIYMSQKTKAAWTRTTVAAAKTSAARTALRAGSKTVWRQSRLRSPAAPRPALSSTDRAGGRPPPPPPGRRARSSNSRRRARDS